MNADVRALCGVSAATANRVLAGLTAERKLVKYSRNGHWAYDAITNHKLSVLIMDEKLENRKNEEITVDNALQYLYYDFER